ncbi:zinc finger protein 678-like isoform X2 [Rhopilema esculentum]
MEICDEEELTEYEIIRQRNIIHNYEFMKSCGLPVKPLLYVKRKKVENVSDEDYFSTGSESDKEDKPWFPNQTEAKKQKIEQEKSVDKRFKPVFKRVREPCKIFGLSTQQSEIRKEVEDALKSSAIPGLGQNDTEYCNKKPSNSAAKKITPIRKRKADRTTSFEKSVPENEINQRRYPKRKERVNYVEAEVPDDDHYLFCEECADFNYGECPVHGPLFPVEDSLVTNTETTETKARASLPDGLEIRNSKIKNAGNGVFALKEIESGTRFGPYQGKKVHRSLVHDGRDTSYMWEIMRDGEICYYIDGKDESIGNWLRFINCARTESEQNLVAYQYHNDIYYRVYKNVCIGDELLVWYGDEYAVELGIENEVKQQEEQPWFDKSKIAFCSNCENCFSSEYIEKHRKWCLTRNVDLNSGHDDLAKNIPSLKKLKKIFSKVASKNNGNINQFGGKLSTKMPVAESKKSKTAPFQSKSKDNKEHKPYICDKCGKGFSTSGSLDTHKRIHTGEKPYICDTCGKGFTQLGSLNKHKRIHTGEKPYICDKCGKGFSTSGSLDTHKRIHTGEKPYICDTCGKGFSTSGSLDTHKRIHTGEKPYICDTCGKGFSTSGSLDTHKRIHTGEKPYICDTCGKGFSTSGSLDTHKRIHTGEKPYICDTCGKGFSTSGSLDTHKRIHTGEKPYICDTCGKGFTQLGSLNKHKRIHTGEKPYICDTCGKGFTESGHLDAHKRIHTGEKPYICDTCGKGFSTSGSLDTHKRIHTGEKPYICDTCGKGFTKSGDLNTHKRIHTGEKPYICDTCGKGFTTPGNLDTHKRIHTGEKPYICDTCGKGFTVPRSLQAHQRTHFKD